MIVFPADYRLERWVKWMVGIDHGVDCGFYLPWLGCACVYKFVQNITAETGDSESVITARSRIHSNLSQLAQ